MNYDRIVHRSVALACLLALPALALANGRPAGTSTITFRQGDERFVAAGVTFGLVVSNDNGTSWQWICEDAIGYGGDFDPDFAYAPTGALFATTRNATVATRDGCTFGPTALGETLVSAITLGPDGALYLASAAPATSTQPSGDTRIHKSLDDGQTFLPDPAEPGRAGDWWTSIEVSPADARRVYLAGYRLSANGRELLLFRSEDGGASFTAMATTGLTATANSTPHIAGISKTDPETVYLRVTYQQLNSTSDGLYRTTDGGVQWQLMLEQPDELAFVARANGDLVAAGRLTGAFVSLAPSNGATWTRIGGAPEISCLVESARGDVWACTQNFGTDDAGIMKSTDLAAWTPVLRFQDVAGPVACAPGTEQRDRCVDEPNMCGGRWCCLRAQLGVTADPTACPVDAAGDASPTPPGGCCQSSRSGPARSALIALIALVAIRRRRR
jgi:hypothetical protein